MYYLQGLIRVLSMLSDLMHYMAVVTAQETRKTITAAKTAPSNYYSKPYFAQESCLVLGQFMKLCSLSLSLLI